MIYAFPRWAKLFFPVYAAVMYAIVVATTLPLDGWTVVLGAMGTIAAGSLPHNFMRLSEKVANGELVVVNGRLMKP